MMTWKKRLLCLLLTGALTISGVAPGVSECDGKVRKDETAECCGCCAESDAACCCCCAKPQVSTKSCCDDNTKLRNFCDCNLKRHPSPAIPPDRQLIERKPLFRELGNSASVLLTDSLIAMERDYHAPRLSWFTPRNREVFCCWRN